jgi:DNA-binding CsgD family transcriptional regulator
VSNVVGRDEEVASVKSFLTGDRGAVLAITGDAGIGKSTVWEEAVRSAERRGALVLVSRPAEAEAKLSFAGLSDLVEGVDASVFESLPAPQRDALEVALLRVNRGSRTPQQRTIATALLSLLRALSVEREVVLAIDDWQWLDPPTRHAVSFAMRRIVDERVRLVVAVRSGGGVDPAELGAASDRIAHIRLGALSVASLHGILAERLGTTFSRPTLVRIERAAAGNPFYALEIARVLAAGGTGSFAVSDDLRALVADRVRALPAETRDALLRVAAMARPELRLIDAEALVSAEEAAFLRIDDEQRIHFAHPLFASAVYAAAPLARRRSAHRELAQVVADPEERARHLALAADGPDEVAAGAASAAARLARERGAPDAAAELAALALKLTADGAPEVDRRRLELADHLFFAGEFNRAADALEPVRTSASSDLRARALLMLADVEYWRTGEAAAIALAEEALRDVSDPLLCARCHALLAMWAGTNDARRSAVEARAALALLERQPNPDAALVSLALAARVRADLLLGDGFDAPAAERALELEGANVPPAVDTRVAFKLGQWLRYADDLDAARRRLVESEETALAEGDESSLPNILLNRVLAECWAGDLETAAVLAARTVVAFEQIGIASDRSRVWQAYVDAHRGDVVAVRAAANAASGRSEPVNEMLWERAVGLAELSAGDTIAADRHLAAALVALDRTGCREPAIWRIHGDAVEAAVAVGNVDRADALTADLERQADRSRIPWNVAVALRCRGLVLAARGDVGGADAVLARALAAHDLCPVPFERARTLLVQGQVSRRLKQKRAAHDALEHALAIFERTGAEMWAVRTRQELQRVRARAAPSELSATELRIAQLAASGLTNQEIAAEAFVSRKTVEANLARAYTKLGIRSRAQLADALAAGGHAAIP